MTTPKSPLIEVAIFIPLAVLGSWTIFGVLGGPGRWQVVQWVMFWPAIAGFGVAWLFRREPPRATGFEYTGALPWLAAFFYPLAMVAAEVGLAYALRLDIRFQPEAVGGLNGFEEKLQRTIFVPLTILFIALAYRWRWPERVRDALPPRLRLLHHGFRALLFVPALWIYHFGQLAPPGLPGAPAARDPGPRGADQRRGVGRIPRAGADRAQSVAHGGGLCSDLRRRTHLLRALPVVRLGVALRSDALHLERVEPVLPRRSLRGRPGNVRWRELDLQRRGRVRNGAESPRRRGAAAPARPARGRDVNGSNSYPVNQLSFSSKMHDQGRTRRWSRRVDHGEADNLRRERVAVRRTREADGKGLLGRPSGEEARQPGKPR